MTTQPQFVPDKGVRIDLEGNLNVNIRLIDCVGYMVNGVENQDRMVNSPWFAHEIPFAEAGEIGTKKVMCDHSTIGIVVTTDGSVTEFARGDYEQSEERIIAELISKVMNALADKTAYLNKMCDYEKLKDIFTADNDFNNVSDINVRFDDGSIAVNIVPKEELFYRVLSDCCGVDVKDESALFGYIKNASRAIRLWCSSS